MIPAKPFPDYKWRWLSVIPTEGLLKPPVFLGVLRALQECVGKPPSGVDFLKKLQRVQEDVRKEIDSDVQLARKPDRNLIRHSGQYWKGTGLLRPARGKISLTNFGEKVAQGLVTPSEFAAVMVQQAVLPNPWTQSPKIIKEWRAANLEVRPLQLILEVIGELAKRHGGLASAFLCNRELVEIVIPLAGAKISAGEMASCVALCRRGELDVSSWPDCAPEDNDRRMTMEFLLFLSYFGILKAPELGATRDEGKFHLEDAFDPEIRFAPPRFSIFESDQSADEAIAAVRDSSLPSMIERNRRWVSMLSRPGQARFRREVLKKHRGRCFLTGESIEDVLEAAHIRPVANHGSDDFPNGFCFRIDIHRLYDAKHLRIRPDGRILFSDAMRESGSYRGMPTQVSIPNFVSLENLAWRESYC